MTRIFSVGIKYSTCGWPNFWRQLLCFKLRYGKN